MSERLQCVPYKDSGVCMESQQLSVYLAQAQVPQAIVTKYGPAAISMFKQTKLFLYLKLALTDKWVTAAQHGDKRLCYQSKWKTTQYIIWITFEVAPKFVSLFWLSFSPGGILQIL